MKRKVAIEVCDRDAFGTAKEATEERKYSVGDVAYRIVLCDQHAAMFDREMAAWTRLSEEIEMGMRGRPKSAYFANERIEEGRRVAELRTKMHDDAARDAFVAKRAAEIEAQEAAAQDERIRRIIPGALGWRLTTHAAERMLERGYSVKEVLEAAAQPENIYLQPWRGPHRAVHTKGRCRVAVDQSNKGILTVLDRHTPIEVTPPNQERKAQ